MRKHYLTQKFVASTWQLHQKNDKLVKKKNFVENAQSCVGDNSRQFS